MIEVEVLYALPRGPSLVEVSMEPGATLRQAIERSGMLQRHPEIDLATCAVGTFGKVRRLEEPVAAGDRIEVYRALTMDPKDRRRLKVSRG